VASYSSPIVTCLLVALSEVAAAEYFSETQLVPSTAPRGGFEICQRIAESGASLG